MVQKILNFGNNKNVKEILMKNLFPVETFFEKVI